MINNLLIFILALATLLASAKFFTSAAEKIGNYLKLPPFVIGIFIVGIGTSLPELISGLFSVNRGVSEILSGNLMGANIANILLVTGLAVVLNKKNITLTSSYIYIDLHFLLGSFMYFCIISFDGNIRFSEAFIGIIIFLIYSFYLIKGDALINENRIKNAVPFPFKHLVLLIISCVGIYFGADFTISSLEKIALALNVPNAIIGVTLLSLGTTLPELAVNISAIRQGKAEMAVGNVLGSCVFNTLVIPPLTSAFGEITVPDSLVRFSLPVMAACGLLFYLLTQDKKISVWEGLMFVCLYILFLIKITIK
jgi:cation:H+ antiporter